MSNKYLLVIFIYYILFSIVMALIVPPFESPDEQLHLSYINYIAKYESLPNQYEGIKNPEKFVGQGHQPPLYYILMATLNYAVNNNQQVVVIEHPNYKHIWYGGTEGKVPRFNNFTYNPFLSGENKRMFYLFRFFSILFGTVTVIFSYKIITFFTDKKIYILLSTLFVSSLPQFVFINSVINNDSLAFMCVTISIYYIFKILKSPDKIKDYIILGVITGISVVTKKLFFS